MEFGQKKFCEMDLSDFMSFFGLDFFYFSGPALFGWFYLRELVLFFKGMISYLCPGLQPTLVKCPPTLVEKHVSSTVGVVLAVCEIFVESCLEKRTYQKTAGQKI